MDDQLENKAQEAAESMEQAANQSWQNIEFAANQGAPAPTPAQPVQPVQPAPPQYYQPPQQAPNDPNRWTGELYTPEVTPPSQPYPHQAPGAYIDSQRAGYAPHLLHRHLSKKTNSRFGRSCSSSCLFCLSASPAPFCPSRSLSS